MPFERDRDPCAPASFPDARPFEALSSRPPACPYRVPSARAEVFLRAQEIKDANRLILESRRDPPNDPQISSASVQRGQRGLRDNPPSTA